MFKTKSFSFKFICSFLIALFSNLTLSPVCAQAPRGYSGFPSGTALPSPNQFVPLSKAYSYPVLEGLKVNPENPFELEFIINPNGKEEVTKEEVKTLVNYFLAGLTVPQEDLWVNLSPYEKNRVIPGKLGETDLGKSLLAQDYLLKQLASSLTHPESLLGKKYWKQLYKKVYESTGNANTSVDTFNKIWIAPENVKLYENKTGVLITEATLKAMLEEDMQSAKGIEREMHSAKSKGHSGGDKKQSSSRHAPCPMPYAHARSAQRAAHEAMKQIILPEIEKDINSGENFAKLRQAYHSLILAVWFKDKLKDSIYSYYINQNKIKGIGLKDKNIKEKVYNLYAQSFKKGVYDYIKTENAAKSISGQKQKIKRKYYSGGIGFTTFGFGASGISFDITRGTSPINSLTSSSLAAKVNFEVLTTASSGIKKEENLLVEDKSVEGKELVLPEGESVVNREEIARILKKMSLNLEEYNYSLSKDRYSVWYEVKKSNLTNEEIVKILAFFWKNIDKLKDLPVSMSLLEKVVEEKENLSYITGFLVQDSAGGLGVASLLKYQAKPELSLKEEQILWKVMNRLSYFTSKKNIGELEFDPDTGKPCYFSKKVINSIDQKIKEKKDDEPIKILHYGCGTEALSLNQLKGKYGDKVEFYGIGYEVDSKVRKDEGMIVVEDNIKKLGEYFEETEFDLIFSPEGLGWFMRERELSKVIILLMEKLAPGGYFISETYSTGQEIFLESLKELGIEEALKSVKAGDLIVAFTKQQNDENGNMLVGLSIASEQQLLDTSRNQQQQSALMVISDETLSQFSFEEEIEDEDLSFVEELKESMQKAIVKARTKANRARKKDKRAHFRSIATSLEGVLDVLISKKEKLSEGMAKKITEIIELAESSMILKGKIYAKLFSKSEYKASMKEVRIGGENGENQDSLATELAKLLSLIKPQEEEAKKKKKVPSFSIKVDSGVQASSSIKKDEGITLKGKEGVLVGSKEEIEEEKEIERILDKMNLSESITIEEIKKNSGARSWAYRKGKYRLTIEEKRKLLAFYWKNIENLKDLPVSMSFIEKVVKESSSEETAKSGGSLDMFVEAVLVDESAIMGAICIIKNEAKLSRKEEVILWKMYTRLCQLEKKENVGELDFFESKTQVVVSRLARQVLKAIDQKISEKKDDEPVKILHLGCGTEALSLQSLKERYGEQVEFYGIGPEINPELREEEDLMLIEDDVRNLENYFDEGGFDIVFSTTHLEWYMKGEGRELALLMVSIMDKMAPGGNFIVSANKGGRANLAKSMERLGADETPFLEQTDNFFVIMTKHGEEEGGLAFGWQSVAGETTLIGDSQSMAGEITVPEDFFEEDSEDDAIEGEESDLVEELKEDIQRLAVQARIKSRRAKLKKRKSYFSSIATSLTDMLNYLKSEDLSKEMAEKVSELLLFTDLCINKKEKDIKKVFTNDKFRPLIKAFRISGGGENPSKIAIESAKLLTNIKPQWLNGMAKKEERISSSIKGGIDATDIVSEIAFGDAQFEFSPEFARNLRGGIEGLRIKSIVLERQN